MKRFLWFLWLLASIFAWSIVPAAPVPLAWDPNPPEEEVVGYILYMGRTSREDLGFTGYEVITDVGNVTTGEMAIPDGWKAPIYFAAIAYNKYDLRSDYSEEISIPAINPPVIRFSFWEGLFRVEPLRCGDCDYDGDVDGADLALVAKELGM